MVVAAAGGGSEVGFTPIDLGVLDGLRQLNAAGLADADKAAERVWLLDGQLHVANGTADGKRGCVTLRVLGVPIKLCWELQDIIVTPPGVSVKANITVSANGAPVYAVSLLFKCADVTHPSTCTVSVENDLALNATLRPRCNWGCLRTCAPACIPTCGTDYWCWAACAAGCVVRCCRIW